MGINFPSQVTQVTSVVAVGLAAPICPIMFLVYDADIKAFGILLSAAFGCFAFGGFIGFIFAIPRANIHNNKHENEPSRWLENTNLEQVSDWLVKVLIGASLVQLTAIKNWLVQFSSALGGCISEKTPTNFAAYLIIYYSVLGFIGFYLLTALKMIPALEAAHRWKSDMERDIKGTLHTLMAVENNDRVERVVEDGQNALNMSKDDSAYHSTLTRALNNLLELTKTEQTDRRIAITIGRIYRRQGTMTDKSVEQGMLNKAIDRLQTTLAVRKAKAIVKGVDDAALLYNIACYQNLTAENLWRSNDANGAERQHCSAWASITESIQIDPMNLQEAKGDPDLKTLPRPDIRVWPQVTTPAM